MKTNIALICVTSLVLGGCGAKHTADKEMQALCAKDGGLKVFETVTLPANEFSTWGQPLDRYWSDQTDPENKLGPDYRFVDRNEFLKRGDTLNGEVQMGKSTTKVFRRSDGKLLGEAISYGRSGGDSYITLLFGRSSIGLLLWEWHQRTFKKPIYSREIIMPTINDYLRCAETALAAYAVNLQLGLIVVRQLIDAGMPDAEATNFATSWTVIAQSPDYEAWRCFDKPCGLDDRVCGLSLQHGQRAGDGFTQFPAVANQVDRALGL